MSLLSEMPNGQLSFSSTGMDAAGRRPPAKRQRYTPVACDKCKKRKIKCSGETPCRQCAKHPGSECVYDRLLPGESASLLNPQKSTAVAEVSSRTDKLAHRHPLWPLSRAEVIDLLEGFREDVQNLYPFIDLHEMTNLVDGLYTCTEEPPRLETTIQSTRWDDIRDSRNVDFLKLLVACALAPKETTGEDVGLKFMLAVEENNFRIVRSMNVAAKDLAISTMLVSLIRMLSKGVSFHATPEFLNFLDYPKLPKQKLSLCQSVYHYQRDNIKLAWRQIGAAARLCLEMGLHRLNRLASDDSETRGMRWATKMFWCIFVLDRRYSFMTNLPFTLQDRDIDFTQLKPDKSAPYLLPMVIYGRLGGRIIPAVPKFGCSSSELDDNTKNDLGNEIDRWVEETSKENCSTQSFVAAVPALRLRNLYQLKIFVQLRANQMRLSLYKHSLYTPSNILKDQNFACLAVQVATQNIQVLNQLQEEFDDFYESHAFHYKFFLVSSLVSLYLGIRNAPQQFSGTSFEYFTGLKLLKSSMHSSISSSELRKTVQTLESAIGNLMYGNVNVLGSCLTPQLSIGTSPMSETNSSIRELVQDVEEVDIGCDQQHIVFPSPEQLTPGPLAASPSSFGFEFQDNTGAFLQEKTQEHNLLQELAMNDFALSYFWNSSSSELFWNGEAVSNGENSWVPEYS